MMDSWNEKELRMMQISGNNKLKDYFEEYDMSIKNNVDRYSSKASEYYRDQLKACSAT